MRVLLKTLLVIALLVQLPLSALAAYSGLNHSHQHSHQHTHAHHHSHAMGGSSVQLDVDSKTTSDESQASNECVTHNHCGVTHLTALPPSRLQNTLINSRHLFGISSDLFHSSAAHTRIERPNWASL
jgi:hypothetical protein